jgi:membrane protein YdbS with pleckstrin-like domain
MNPDQNSQPPLTNPAPTLSPVLVAPSPVTINNPLTAMQPGEQVLAEIKRHPIGLIGNYIVTGGLVLLTAVGAIFAPHIVSSDMQHQASVWGATAFVIVAAFAFITILITTTVYKGNRWIVTSDSLTQIMQVSLFSKQSSQLSLHNLEDVTVLQNGIIQSAFNFGTLHAETAGERAKFVFRYCPDPNARTRDILMAREKFMGQGGFPGRNSESGVDINMYNQDNPQ